MENVIHTKLLIIGSGPAGYTAAIYAARACLDPILVCGLQKGGQLTITTEVENFPGFPLPIQGPWLMEQMDAQAKNVGTQIVNDYIRELDLKNKPFTLYGDNNTKYIADSIIICTGAEARYLGLDSERKFLGYGVSACATCDGFFYKGKKVMVIGGGNTAVEEALYLTNHASEILLVHRRDQLRAEKILQNRLFSNPKIKVIWNAELTEVIGNEKPKSVTGARLLFNDTKKIEDIDVDGIFIAIGHSPNTGIFKGQLNLDKEGYIITIPGTTQTNIEGVFAAGDVQDKVYRQAITAAGTGCMAALEAQNYLSLL